MRLMADLEFSASNPSQIPVLTKLKRLYLSKAVAVSGIIDLLYVLANFTFSAKKKMRKKLFFS
jgi:hypothetical protein